SVRRRFAVQIAIASSTTVWLSLEVTAGAAVVFIAFAILVWIVGYVNAFNFMDGINGISVAQIVAAGLAWGMVGAWEDQADLVGASFGLVGAALAFMPFNFPNARVFLGDVGSYFFGGWLAVLAVASLSWGLTVEMALAPLLLYACDTGVTLLRRI